MPNSESTKRDWAAEFQKTIYHVVTPSDTITFLDEQTRAEWVTSHQMDAILCDSKIPTQFYEVMLDWHADDERPKHENPVRSSDRDKDNTVVGKGTVNR